MSTRDMVKLNAPASSGAAPPAPDDSLGGVRIGSELVTRMLSEHGQWAYRLVRAIETDPGTLAPDSLVPDDQCAVGRWLYGDGRVALAPGVYADVTDRHRRLHQSAAQLLTLAAQGEPERALAAAAPGGEFSLAANSLVATFESWRAAEETTQAANPVPPRVASDELLGNVFLVRAEAEAAEAAIKAIGGTVHALSDGAGQGLSAITEIADAAGATAHEAHESRVRTENSQRVLVGLQQSVGRVGEVLALIARIAKNTNLLVLNANIEAVRVGEAGKGFGVVAREVKQLADDVSGATREVRGIIAAVQHDAGAVLGEIDEFLGSISRIADNQILIAQAVEHQQSVTRQMMDGLTTMAESIDVIEENASSAAYGARNAAAVGGVLIERLHSVSLAAAGQPTKRYRLRGAPGWFLTPDLAHLVECAHDGEYVRFYSVAGGDVVGELRPQHGAPPCGGGVFVSPDGRLVLVSWDSGGAFRLWDVGSGAAVASFQDTGTPLRVAVNEERWRLVAETGRMAQVGRYRREVATMWDLHTGTAVEDVAVENLDQHHPGYHTRSVADAFATEALTPDQRLYAVAAQEGAVVLYDAQTDHERFRVAEATARSVRTAFSADGALLLAHWESDDTGWVDVWEL